MAAEYPAAVKTFNANVDLSTQVTAAYMTQRDQEITALESALGTYPYGGAIGMFQSLPGLRGFWPLGPMAESGSISDISGQSRTLSNSGASLASLSLHASLVPYLEFNGEDTQLTRTSEDGLNTSGTESYVGASFRGLTLGGWFWISSFSSAGYFFSKDDMAANRSYGMYYQTDGSLRFGVFNDGGTYFETISSGTMSTGAWCFLVGRAKPSTTEVATFINGTKTAVNVGGLFTEVNQSSAEFRIGARSDDAAYLNGRAALCFLCASALSDTVISTLFSQTRRRFGV